MIIYSYIKYIISSFCKIMLNISTAQEIIFFHSLQIFSLLFSFHMMN